MDLSFKPSKRVSYLFDGTRHSDNGIQLSLRMVPSFGKFLEVSLSATKSAANMKMCSLLSQLLFGTALLPIRGEYKLWLYRNYIVSSLRFHLSVDAVTRGAITRMESLTV